MDKSTIIYILTMGWTLIIYGGITFLLVKKKEYMLISGFWNRPEEEQEYLKQNGYTEALGKLFLVTFILLLVTFILGFLPIRYGFEIGISTFIIVLLVGLVFVQRYEVPAKRKKMYWISGTIAAGTILFLAGLSVVGYMDNEVTMEGHTLKISGMYGVEWDLAEIESVELLPKLPKVEVRKNGFSTAGLLKGQFLLEEPYGSGLLFVKGDSGPFLYIVKDDDFIILNREDKKETEALYHTIRKYME